jgi:hypothetical protein
MRITGRSTVDPHSTGWVTSGCFVIMFAVAAGVTQLIVGRISANISEKSK